MTNLWQFIIRVFKQDNQHASSARERLKMVLVQDRVKITPETLNEIKADLAKTLSEYLEVGVEDLNISLTSEGSQTSLVANIPVKGGRAEIVAKKHPAEAPPKKVSTTTATKSTAKPSKPLSAKKAGSPPKAASVKKSTSVKSKKTASAAAKPKRKRKKSTRKKANS